jgi:hypothetical protein
MGHPHAAGLKGHTHGGGGADGARGGSGSGGGGGGGGGPRYAFDLVYYSEADNVCFLSHHEAFASAALAFLDDPALGGTSFLTPNRLEYNGRNPSAGLDGESGILVGLQGVGQNNCKDDRGDVVAYQDGKKTITKGTPHETKRRRRARA